ncbi:MAG: TlpA disulfide reductase family protein [Bacteroidales bacterium]
MKVPKIATIILLSTFVLFASCTGGDTSDKKQQTLNVPILDFEGVRPLLEKSNDTTYVVNFWATWCSPCVKEIPYFERIGEEYSNQKVKVILINLDFSNHYDTRLIPYLEENNIKSKVVMLDDPDANSWINEVSPEWSGAIPATIIYNKSKRSFFEKEFTFEELDETLQDFLN